MAKDKTDLLQGTLDLLILKALQRAGSTHGYGISVQLRAWSKEALQIDQGSLYPALYRLEERGWIDAAWGVSENNRKAKFYTLTKAGLKQLAAETTNWRNVSAAINTILEGA